MSGLDNNQVEAVIQNNNTPILLSKGMQFIAAMFWFQEKQLNRNIEIESYLQEKMGFELIMIYDLLL